MFRSRTALERRLAVLLVLAAAAAGCRDHHMVEQPRLEPLELFDFYEDGRASRHPPVGTVPFGGFREDLALHTGMLDGAPLAALPITLSAGLLDRGRERFDIFCSPCHDRAGTGGGIVIRRGFRSQPPSFHIDRLREAPVGHFFDVITHGFGAMQDYAAVIRPEDRWAIIAYIRALQLSQAAPVEMAPADVRDRLESE